MPAFRPTRPRFRAHTTAVHSIAAGLQLVPWDVIDVDDAGGYSAGTYVIDRDGFWITGWHLSRNSIALSSQPQASLQLNGVEIAAARGINRLEGQGFSSSDVFSAAAGDVIGLKVVFSSTVAVNLNADARWYVTRIGPKSWNF